MSPAPAIDTARLALRPVARAQLPELAALKADPGAFDLMLGGVRSPAQTAAELEQELAFWSAHGTGIWLAFARDDGRFVGIAGLMDRPDRRGIALRFALWPAERGRGLAQEAAAAALAHGHAAGIDPIIAVAWSENLASRQVLREIGMVEVDAFLRDGRRMVVHASRAGQR